MINIKSKKEIELMKVSAEALKETLKAIEAEIRPGISTLYLNEVAEKTMKKMGATPAFKGVPCPYRGGKTYKWAICTSVNDEIIHGIPSSDVILKEGDIVCVDLGTMKNGWASDAGRTYIVGKTSKENERLIKVTKEAFFKGIEQAIPGNRIGDISNAIQTYVEENGYSLLREYEGHGIGRDMHEEPGVPNVGKKGRGPRLEVGMALAIEPMVCAGSSEVYVKRDLWTVATMDKSMSAYYENTIVITEDGVEILTLD